MTVTHPTNTYLARRPMVLGLVKVLFLALSQVSAIQAAPTHISRLWIQEEEPAAKPANDPSLWFDLGVSLFLVLAGGAFAGLTIALMGQDEIYLQVIRDSGEGTEVKHAAKVLKLLKKGKHWVLVTLLLSNVITNETLPIVLDRSLGGGWPAVLSSTVLIVIFGEIVPQSICVRYGLPIGAWMSPAVLLLMYIMAPVAWPTAKLLDYLLGKDHGTTYKKAGLKTLVSLHRNMGEAGQRLHADEVTIIGAVLDLKEKPIGSIMTPMDDVFTLSLDDVLDEETMDDILSQGYSRIPIHHPDNNENFVGMLLVKMLITYDPEDAKPVRDFALATLPETRPSTSCLDIVNFFQEGKSHMVLVSNHPGEDHGGIGVVTLEDVIEELIGEEIIDESDVYVDVHKAIRRMAPAPRNKFPRITLAGLNPKSSRADFNSNTATATSAATAAAENGSLDTTAHLRRMSAESGTKETRRISGVSLLNRHRASQATSVDDVKEHLKHLGPSNLASRPKTTKYTNVKIKPGADASESPAPRDVLKEEEFRPRSRRISASASDYAGGIGEGLIPSGGRPASDGVQALAQGYGTLTSSPADRRPTSAHKSIQADRSRERRSPPSQERQYLSRPSPQSRGSHDTLGDLPERTRSSSPTYHTRGPARSGSITENIIDTNGIRKVVLETTSSSESSDETDATAATKTNPDEYPPKADADTNGEDRGRIQFNDSITSKKKRRQRKKKGGRGESEPLLG